MRTAPPSTTPAAAPCSPPGPASSTRRRGWTCTCDCARPRPSTARHAQRWIFQTLTGSPPRLAHPDIAPASRSQDGQYLRFRGRILPAEHELLHHTARTLLDEHGIDEPIQWTPRLPSRTLRRLALPGPDPDSIAAARLHQAVPGGDYSITRLAHTLQTTPAHVVYLLSQHPADWSGPRFRRTQTTATRVAQWRTWYEQRDVSLQTSPTAKEPASPPSTSPCSRTALPYASQEPARLTGEPLRGRSEPPSAPERLIRHGFGAVEGQKDQNAEAADVRPRRLRPPIRKRILLDRARPFMIALAVPLRDPGTESDPKPTFKDRRPRG